jgi:hypothetical protein
MKRLPGILAVALAFGCGTPAAPAQHAPPAVTQDDASTDEQASPDTHEADTPAHVITGPNPFTDIGPKCKQSFPQISHASLPIITSQEQLDKLMGCKTTLVVDWSKEHVVPVPLEGINRAWRLEGLGTQGGVTTITIHTSTIARGAALHVNELWLVRVPAATKSAVIQWTFQEQKLDAPLYP